MEAFSLLKYWRTSGGGAGGSTTMSTANAAATKTVVSAAAATSPYSSDGEDGPYFDLEFALQDQESDADVMPTAKSERNDENAAKTESEDETESASDEEEEISLHENDDDEDEEGELKFALESNDFTDKNATLSPSDELFFKGDLVSIEPSSILLNGSEENSKIPVFLMKSATKFRVLLLKLKKSKSNNGENPVKAEKPERDDSGGQISATPKAEEKEINQGKMSGKFFAVKFKVDGAPIVSLFTRDTSSKENHGKGLKPNTVEDSDERKLTKEVVQKYLKMVKPFYIRVSKRYAEKLKFSGHPSFPGGGSKGSCVAGPKPASPSAAAEVSAEAAARNAKSHQKQGNNLQAGLKVVRKHLGKSRSASAAAAAAEAAAPPNAASNRRDDSLLQLQDGIQGAILHCKRSFNSARDSESSSILCRSVSDPSYSHEKSAMKTKPSSASTSSSFAGDLKESKGLATQI